MLLAFALKRTISSLGMFDTRSFPDGNGGIRVRLRVSSLARLKLPGCDVIAER